MKIDIKEFIGIFIRGFLMGSVETTPGFSGGTMALITGIYDKLVHSIGKIKFKFVKPLLTGKFSDFKKVFLDEINFAFFIPLFIGMAIALVSVSKLVSFSIDNFPVYTFSFFIGLIVSSAYILYTHINNISVKSIIISIIAFILAFLFVGLNPIAANHSLIVIFFSGMIAICAFILPGIAGAFVLMLLGQYEYMLNVLHNFSIVEIIVFVVGAAIGILSFSKFLDYLLDRYKDYTMAFLIGIMAGTLRIPISHILDNLSSTTSYILPVYVYIIIFVVIGLILIPFLEKKFNYIE